MVHTNGEDLECAMKAHMANVIGGGGELYNL